MQFGKGFIGVFEALFRGLTNRRRGWLEPAVPDGMVVQVIGDVHGCLDQLEQMLDEFDQLRPKNAARTLILLGDLIDRGGQSRGVVERVIQLKSEAAARGDKVVSILGNHEQLMLDFLAEPERKGGRWIQNGGVNTLRSYGVFVDASIMGARLKYCCDEFQQKFPATHLALIKGAPLSQLVGDYFFCHAGVDPKVSLERQVPEVLLWTRNLHLLDTQAIEKFIVHGHSPVKEAVTMVGHINIDTGAWATGKLTGLSLVGRTRQIVVTERRKPAQ